MFGETGVQDNYGNNNQHLLDQSLTFTAGHKWGLLLLEYEIGPHPTDRQLSYACLLCNSCKYKVKKDLL